MLSPTQPRGPYTVAVGSFSSCLLVVKDEKVTVTKVLKSHSKTAQKFLQCTEHLLFIIYTINYVSGKDKSWWGKCSWDLTQPTYALKIQNIKQRFELCCLQDPSKNQGSIFELNNFSHFAIWAIYSMHNELSLISHELNMKKKQHSILLYIYVTWLSHSHWLIIN